VRRLPRRLLVDLPDAPNRARILKVCTAVLLALHCHTFQLPGRVHRPVDVTFHVHLRCRRASTLRSRRRWLDNKQSWGLSHVKSFFSLP